MKLPVYLLYRTGFAPTNGTSVYLERLLQGLENPVVHLMWDISEAGAQSVRDVVVVDDNAARWPFPFRRGRGVYMRCRDLLGLNWWTNGQLNQRRLRRALKSFHARPARAWIICMHESDARRACAIWEAIGHPPFVLHVMDIFHTGLSQAETPTFRRLVGEARHVICISDNIASEVRNSGAKSVGIVPCCAAFSGEGRETLKRPLRIVITGTIWSGVYEDNPAARLLLTAWPEIKARFPDVELHYAGACGAHLPEQLRDEIHNHGLLSHSAYHNLLLSCHLAYLLVSHPGSTVGRYSVPSRLADYLACGLPTIVCTDQATAISAFLNDLPHGCALNVSSAEALVQAVIAFVERPSYWAEASTKAAAYARGKLHVDVVRAELFRQLESAIGLKIVTEETQ